MPTNEPTTKEWRPAFFTTGEDCCIWLVDPKSRCGYSLSSFRYQGNEHIKPPNLTFWGGLAQNIHCERSVIDIAPTLLFI
ncbi:hypothetical protein LENED_009543 [Lentinula edodes]|uniref:Uncharacterized protein n=1 Tax=Lentinula edodes TaxID=5353 RepID=A0A1Q3EK13_LENED|nr:hypothetical protein LENED_009543 [Lentinula edodes]